VNWRHRDDGADEASALMGALPPGTERDIALRELAEAGERAREALARRRMN